MRIIVKKPDSGVIIINFNEEKYGPEYKEIPDDLIEGKINIIRPYEECKGLKPYIELGYEWFLSDQPIDKSDLESRKQLYHDGDVVKKDISWEKSLMPDQLIKKKHLKKLGEDLDIELNSEAPDPIKTIKLQREIDKCKDHKAGVHNEDCKWCEIALEGLKHADIPKPEIEKKLKDKIKELK